VNLTSMVNGSLEVLANWQPPDVRTLLNPVLELTSCRLKPFFDAQFPPMDAPVRLNSKVLPGGLVSLIEEALTSNEV
jgi:hypothetical protein